MHALRRASRRLCIFQMHHTDADEKLLARSAVPRVKESGLFDEVVLAAADVPENRVLARWAEAWGVALHYGAERDVARRLLDCARARRADVVARGLVWWFFVDLDLVARLIAELEDSAADYVRLPNDCDIRFGLDVFRPRLLEKLGRAFEDEALRPSFELNPWGYVEAYPDDFDVLTHAAPPVYDEARFRTLRAEMAELWPARWDGAATPLFPYRLARGRLRDGGTALDVACGLGAGTAVLGERGRALGVDVSAEAVAHCRSRHAASGAGAAGRGCEFVQGDALALELAPRSFDVVTSVHTLEHLADDRAFLERAAGWLRPEGLLVLEVPLLARHPFRDVGRPLSPDHLREYELGALLELVSERFEVHEAFGVNRGAYVDPGSARSAALLTAVPRRAA